MFVVALLKNRQNLATSSRNALKFLLNSYGCLNSRVALVVFKREIFVCKGEKVCHRWVDLHDRQRIRLAGQLQPGLFYMIIIQVHVSEGMYELTGLQSSDLRYHHGEERVRSNIKGHTQEHICAALVQLAGELAIGHIKLEQCMARAQAHARQVAYIPCVYDHPAAVGVCFQLVQYIFYLVVGFTVGARPGAPLVAVDGPQVAIGIRPFIPYPHAVVF